MIILILPQEIAQIALVQSVVIQKPEQFLMILRIKPYLNHHHGAKQDKKRYDRHICKNTAVQKQGYQRSQRNQSRNHASQKQGKLPHQRIKAGSPVVVMLNPGTDVTHRRTVQKRIIHGDRLHAHQGIKGFPAHAGVNLSPLLKISLQYAEQEDGRNAKCGNQKEPPGLFPGLQSVQNIGGQKDPDKGIHRLDHGHDQRVEQEPSVHLPQKLERDAYLSQFTIPHFPRLLPHSGNICSAVRTFHCRPRLSVSAPHGFPPRPPCLYREKRSCGRTGWRPACG